MNLLSSLDIDESAWLIGSRRVESPNFNRRPDGVAISLLVIHNISLPPGEFGGGEIEAFFCNQLDHAQHPYFEHLSGRHVSAHCLIDRKGTLSQFVSFKDRAWHAGQSCFEGRQNCNDFSIGIELEGTDDRPYTEQQYKCLCILTKLLFIHYPGLNIDRIVGHSDIAPERKTDPGPAFDWDRYRRALRS